jgi:SAM-dependent methyltransferase
MGMERPEPTQQDMGLDRGSTARPEDWDTSYRLSGNQRLWPDHPTLDDDALQRFRADGARVVLDAGCGDGKNLAHLAAQGFFAVGVDVSRAALAKADAYLRQRQLAERYFLFGPARLESLPLLDGAARAAVCIDVLGHSNDPGKVLAELARVLLPGGALYASVFHLGDGCRNGPRMRRGAGPEEYWYRPNLVSPDGPQAEYLYRFYDEAEARRLFEAAPFRIVSLRARRWDEPPHPGYREEPHTHESWFALLQRQ